MCRWVAGIEKGGVEGGTVSVQVAMADRAAALSAYVQVGDGRRVGRRRRGANREWEVGEWRQGSSAVTGSGENADGGTRV